MLRTLLCRLDTMKALIYRISITGYRMYHPLIEESCTSHIPFLCKHKPPLLEKKQINKRSKRFRWITVIR